MIVEGSNPFARSNKIKGFLNVTDFWHGFDTASPSSREKLPPFARYLEHLHRRGMGQHHLRDVKRFVGAFVEALPVEITTFRTHAIDDWLGGL